MVKILVAIALSLVLMGCTPTSKDHFKEGELICSVHGGLISIDAQTTFIVGWLKADFSCVDGTRGTIRWREKK